MAENKFIKRLHGKETAKSVVEIKNTATPTMFTNMPAGDSNVFNTYSDHRGNATGVLRGTDNWKLSGSSLVPATTVYGDGRDMTGAFVVGNAGLWIDATYTFTEPKLFTPNTEWVLKLCGNGLLSDSNDTVELTMLIKFGSTMVSKTFFLPEQSFSFSEELVIDFSESVAQTTKVNTGDTMVVQVLCGDNTAHAQIYNGMTVLTALQRRVDAETVASDKKTFDEVVDDVVQIQEDLDDLEEYVDDTFVRLDGTSVMTGPLLMRATESFKCAVAPYWDGIGFFKLNDNDSVTLMASIEYNSGFEPATTNTYNIGANSRKWKNLYLSGKAFVSTINNGADINIPAVGGKMAVQVSTMPTAASELVGQIYQFTGTTDANYTNGYFYKCVEDADNPGTYLWEAVQMQATGNYLPLSGGTMTGTITYATSGTTGDTATKILSNTDNRDLIRAGAFGSMWVGSGTTYIASPCPTASGNSLGSNIMYWGTVYARKLNRGANGADINIPNQAGTMVVADTTGATQGQVLTLDSNLKPAWADASSGGNYHPDLFDWKWADHICNDVQWLRADTFSWQSGSVYESAYQHLVDDLGITQTTYYAWYDSGDNVRYYTLSETPSANDTLYQEVSGSMVEVSSESAVLSSYDSSTTPPRIRVWTLGGTESYYRDTSNDITVSRAQTETIAGVTITYYPSADGHKIVLADQETNVTAIYNATGVAWYYIIDTTNERFKLPRAKPLTGGVAGNGIALGLTDGTNNMALGTSNSIGNSPRTNTKYGQSVGTTSDSYTGSVDKTIGITTDPTKSGIIAERDNTDQCKYLYFYVGEFTQTAIENTAGLNAELFNDKVDKGHQVIAFQAPTAQNNYTWYRLYADGWVEQGGYYTGVVNAGSSVSITLPITMVDANYIVLITGEQNSNAWSGASLKDSSRTTTGFDIFAIGGSSGDKIKGASWQVSGMSAS